MSDCVDCPKLNKCNTFKMLNKCRIDNYLTIFDIHNKFFN